MFTSIAAQPTTTPSPPPTRPTGFHTAPAPAHPQAPYRPTGNRRTSRRTNRSLSCSSTSLLVSLRDTSIARHSRVNSSTIVSIRNARPSDVRSMTKSWRQSTRFGSSTRTVLVLGTLRYWDREQVVAATTAGRRREPNQPRRPYGLRGDRHHQSPPFSTAQRRRFQPPSTICGCRPLIGGGHPPWLGQSIAEIEPGDETRAVHDDASAPHTTRFRLAAIKPTTPAPTPSSPSVEGSGTAAIAPDAELYPPALYKPVETNSATSRMSTIPL